MRVLGIETSCDETGVAIYDSEQGLLGDALYSQIDMHAEYGGVVPELASRDHVRKLLPLVREVLDLSGLGKADLDAIAYTSGPGLIGALMVGASTAHARWRSRTRHSGARRSSYGRTPARSHARGRASGLSLRRALLVSGGHTQLVQVDGIGSAISCWANRWTMPPAKPSTRLPRCWTSIIPGGPRSSAPWREQRRPAAASASPGR